MSENNNTRCCPWSTSGASHDITGCRFSIAPMSDNYIDIILGAIKEVDTSKVWAETDDLSTIYRGKRVHVLDALKACFIQANQKDVHMTLEATFSKGCPGDSDADNFLTKNLELMNELKSREKNFNVRSKISFYPLGEVDYMNHIAHVVNLAIDKKLYDRSAHYVSVLEGDIHELFEYFDEVLQYGEENLSHYVLQVTLSVNSPTKR